MRGFTLLIVLVFVVATIPILAMETKLVSKTGEVESRLIENQKLVNIQDDIIRTFKEVMVKCKEAKDPRICAVYFEDWKMYWSGKGFNIVSGKLRDRAGRIVVTKTGSPHLSPRGVLRPSENMTDFGILVEKGNLQVVINRGVWVG